MEVSSIKLLKAIESICQSCKDDVIFDHVYMTKAAEMELVRQFYSVNEFQAVVLSLIIHDHIKDEGSTMHSLAAQLNISFAEMGELAKCLRSLTVKRLIKGRKCRDGGGHYVVYPDVLTSTYAGKKLQTEVEDEDQTFKFLSNIRSECSKVYREQGSTYDLSLQAEEILQEAEHLSFVQWLHSLQLNIKDTLLLINSCYQHLIEDSLIDLDYMLKFIFDDPHEKYNYKRSLTKEENELLKKDLLGWPGGSINSGYFISLSKNTISKLLQFDLKTSQKGITSKYFKVYKPEDVAEEMLFYNCKEENEISRLKNALTAAHYTFLKERLKQNNYLTGITVLFYGAPGTGKTATAYQIARETNRVLLYTDASSIQNMWLGESEKNIKRLFDDYKNISEQLEQQPILLFNEADGILSNRVKVTGSVNQTMNTVQNMLLQELERFEGIFIATTNLIENIDPAFERRFLYKIMFENPSEETLIKILDHAFPDISAEEMMKKTGNLKITGSNISNIKKKLLLRTAFENVNTTADILIELLSEEFYIKQMPQIGFIKN